MSGRHARKNASWAHPRRRNGHLRRRPTTTLRRTVARGTNRVVGRPTSFTKELGDAIVQSVREGNVAHVAAQAHGVSYRCFKSWLNKGEHGTEPYVSFSAGIARARAEAEGDAVACLRDGMRHDPRLAIEYLRRRNSANWAERNKHDVKVKSVDAMSLEDTLRELAADPSAREMLRKLLGDA